MTEPARPILPPAAIGILGGGQLGRMLALAARPMGYRIHAYCPDPDPPIAALADRLVRAHFDDTAALEDFLSGVAVLTWEFENVPAAIADLAEERGVPARPAGRVLHIAQNRLREKTFLAEAGLPVTPFRAVNSEIELRDALAELGRPAVLKTAAFGYDGKGQVKIAASQADDLGEAARQAWAALGGAPSILEAFVDFSLEISVVAARGLDGRTAHWGAIENLHENHILDLSVAPARVSAAVRDEATTLAKRVLDALDVVGILCIECFVLRDGRVLINELAPRPHNSGHLTIEASPTSQFEQQLRAICGLPLGDTRLHGPAAMANLLGELWSAGEPDWAAALADPAVKLHLYDKPKPRPDRKMGHLTALGATPDEAAERVLAARRALTKRRDLA